MASGMAYSDSFFSFCALSFTFSTYRSFIYIFAVCDAICSAYLPVVSILLHDLLQRLFFHVLSLLYYEHLNQATSLITFIDDS